MSDWLWGMDAMALRRVGDCLASWFEDGKEWGFEPLTPHMHPKHKNSMGSHKWFHLPCQFTQGDRWA